MKLHSHHYLRGNYVWMLYYNERLDRDELYIRRLATKQTWGPFDSQADALGFLKTLTTLEEANK